MPSPLGTTSIGRPRGGLWLVTKNGSGAIVTTANLPKSGQGFSYRWLGKGDTTGAESNLYDALTNGGTNFDKSTSNAPAILQTPQQNGKTPIPGAKTGLAALFQGVDIIPIPAFGLGGLGLGAGESTAIGAGEGAAVGTAEGAAAGSGAGTLFGKVAGGITDNLSFLKWAAWLIHPLVFLRAVEFFTGMVFMGIGMYMQLADRTSVVPTPRRVIRRVVR